MISIERRTPFPLYPPYPTILDDFTSNGLWCGDIYELAANYWKLKSAKADNRIARLESLPDIRKVFKTITKYIGPSSFRHDGLKQLTHDEAHSLYRSCIKTIIDDVHFKNLGAAFCALDSLNSCHVDRVAHILSEIFFNSKTGGVIEPVDIENNAVLNLIKARCEREPGFTAKLIRSGQFKTLFSNHDITLAERLHLESSDHEAFRHSIRSSNEIYSASFYDFICSIDCAKIKTLNPNDAFLDLMALSQCLHPYAEMYAKEIVRDSHIIIGVTP